MSVKHMKTIDTYEKYFVRHDNRVFGFHNEGRTEVKFYDDKEKEFKPKDIRINKGILYFSQEVSENIGTEEEPEYEDKVYYYKQEKSILSEIKKSDMPAKKESEFGTYSSANWELSRRPFNRGIMLCYLQNKYFKGATTFIKISDCYETDAGIFFNVVESGKPGCKEGLWFFPKERTAPGKVDEEGEIY